MSSTTAAAPVIEGRYRAFGVYTTRAAAEAELADQAAWRAEQGWPPATLAEATDGVTITHRRRSFASGWVVWSDGVVTRDPLPYDEPWTPDAGVSRDAAWLVDDALGADGGHVDGGWATLLEIDAVLASKRIGRGLDRGVYQAAQVTQLLVRRRDGTLRQVYVYTAGYPEGYAWGLYATRAAAVAASAGTSIHALFFVDTLEPGRFEPESAWPAPCDGCGARYTFQCAPTCPRAQGRAAGGQRDA